MAKQRTPEQKLKDSIRNKAWKLKNKEHRAEYEKQWRAEHPENVKRHARTKYLKFKETDGYDKLLEKNAEWRRNNRPKQNGYIKAYRKRRAARDPAYKEHLYIKQKEASKRYRDRFPERVRASSKKYKTENREQVRAYERNLIATNPEFKLARNMRIRINQALKREMAKKTNSMIKSIGCSVRDLMKHLESKFQSGMSWDNYGKWHVDHEKPCASFNLADPEQQKICFHYTNLQPLWAIDNITKSNKFTPQPVRELGGALTPIANT